MKVTVASNCDSVPSFDLFQGKVHEFPWVLMGRVHLHTPPLKILHDLISFLIESPFTVFIHEDLVL